MNIQYIYLIIFVCLAYLIVTDSSIAKLFVYLSSFVKIEYEKKKWWLLHNPRNPVVKYLMWRRSMKLAKELEQELRSNAK